MSAKTFLLFLLGMSVSFVAIVWVMYAVLVPDVPRPAPRRLAPAPRSRPAGPAPERGALRSGQVTRGAPPMARAAPPGAGPTASAAAPQIAELKQQLDEQILRMKKERDQMLAELVRQLTAMSPAQAAAQLVQVDDEVASLALARMTAAQRQAIRRHLDAKRAGSPRPPR